MCGGVSVQFRVKLVCWRKRKEEKNKTNKNDHKKKKAKGFVTRLLSRVYNVLKEEEEEEKDEKFGRNVEVAFVFEKVCFVSTSLVIHPRACSGCYKLLLNFSPYRLLF